MRLPRSVFYSTTYDVRCPFRQLQPRDAHTLHFLDPQFAGADRQHIAHLGKAAQPLRHPATQRW